MENLFLQGDAQSVHYCDYSKEGYCCGEIMTGRLLSMNLLVYCNTMPPTTFAAKHQHIC
jgi:hypothetical protein